MKRIIGIMLAAATLVLTAGEASAQMGKREYINGGWQYNGSVANDFVQAGNGYGAYIEGGYYVTPMFAVGGFASFNTNNQYVPKQTYTFSDNSALTTDLDRSLYQVPFGMTMRYRFLRTEFQPYVSAKVGTEYSVQSTYMSTFVSRSDNWGFYISPEIGLTFFPFPTTDFGFQIAAYYSYATNQNKNNDIKGLNNVGFKLGIAF
ncbi:MAG: outer membrane beta-barrel protein [Bacteroidales bacterium]|jgi:hypothetical protein|nr:outer membrane beta-barrel protein [Bacteroidales bacterium]